MLGQLLGHLGLKEQVEGHLGRELEEPRMLLPVAQLSGGIVGTFKLGLNELVACRDLDFERLLGSER